MHRILFVLLAFVALLAAADPAAACSCARNPTAASLLASSAAVFTATVEDTKEVGKYRSVTTFRITESFKGPAAGTIVTVRHPSGPSASCGVKFEPGTSVTLAAHDGTADNPGLSATLCSTWMFQPQVGLSEKLIKDLRALRGPR